MILRDWERWMEYTPESHENRSQTMPMTLECKPLTAGELKRHRLSMAPKVQGKGAVAAAERAIDEMLRDRVRNVVGLTLRRELDDGTHEDIAITDGTDFAQYATDELRAEMYKLLTEGATLDDAEKKA